MKVGDLVKRKQNGELGILFQISRSYGVDPRVNRFEIMWSHFGFCWDCLNNFEVIDNDRQTT